ncbi:hypothetical protein [Mesorhizobium sp.]|uniref:hypothetical protein n=1 Tax=Mesorhizobium sp. TaxID=1871066 RepID=UPI000FE75B43|nr:hypothetical protein [Mesorhizobium sp.]RWO61674.1 MAG: hypothetical protein EOS14_10755 [Mesorhizobium sp.]
MPSSYLPFSPWLLALMLAAFCAALEAWLSGPKPFRFLASLKQPRWALPIWGWMIVGGAFYVIMTYGASAMLQAREQGFARDDNSRYGHRWGLELPIVPLQTPRLGLLLVAATTVAVFTVDMLAGGLIAICFAFLPYDFAWTKALAKLNPHLSLESGQ